MLCLLSVISIIVIVLINSQHIGIRFNMFIYVLYTLARKVFTSIFNKLILNYIYLHLHTYIST